MIYLYLFMHVFCWLHPMISMPWLRHLGCIFGKGTVRAPYKVAVSTVPIPNLMQNVYLNQSGLKYFCWSLYKRCLYSAHFLPEWTVLWGCIGAVQKRSTYSAHVTWWINWSFKCIRSDAFLGGIVRALFVQRHSVSREGRVLALFRRSTEVLFEQRPWRILHDVLHFSRRGAVHVATYNDSYSAQGIFFSLIKTHYFAFDSLYICLYD